MISEYIPLDDPRVTLECSRLGRVYTLDGPQSSETHPFAHTTHENGLHQEPRMTSVMAPIRTWNLNQGDWCEIEIEDVSLLGIALELAEHHWDCDLYIDDRKVYGEFGCVSTYLPSSDGYGAVHWIMIERGKHKVRLVVSDKANRMHELCQIEPTHACLNGFILLSEIAFPPPVYNTWMFTQDELPGERRHAKGSLTADAIPAGGYLYLMDLYGRGTLDSLSFAVTAPIILEIMDGGVAQPEYQWDFPSWIRRVNLAEELNESVRSTTVQVTQKSDTHYQLIQLKKILFGSRLIVRLSNPFQDEHQISGLYMEGSLKSM